MTPTTTTTSQNPGVTVQLAIHNAVRRDVGRLARALEEGAPADAVRDYWAAFQEQLHEHHTFEDTFVWPLMRERLGASVADLLDRNLREHDAMSAAMGRFAAEVVTLGENPTAAHAALAELDEAIRTHLADEEADVLPLVDKAFTLADIAFFSAESAKTNPGPKFLPWLLDDAADGHFAFFTGQMPPPVRAMLEESWIPQWRVIANALGCRDLAVAH